MSNGVSYWCRTCLPKQVLKFLFPTIRRVYIPDNSSEIEKLQNALNASQTGRQHLEDQVGHLMVQCERYMFTSAAHAKGEKDAMKEIGRLKRRLETEIEARQEAEEARDREIEKAAMLLAHLPVTPAGRNKAYSGATRVQRIQHEDSSDDEAEEISTVSVGRNTHPLPVPERRRDDNLRTSTSHSTRLSAQSCEHVLDPRRQSQPSNQNPPASNPSPIHGATKRYIPISDSSDSDSDSDIIDIGLGGDGSDREEHGVNAKVSRIIRSIEGHVATSSSAITPRRRVMRQLPVRPTKRMKA
ncbi:hypothetical protein PM082_011190 [Marasmius tenuissimus]|nr:hypothetical protein PM082_011190 [Marasmius tenuissimus]